LPKRRKSAQSGRTGSWQNEDSPEIVFLNVSPKAQSQSIRSRYIGPSWANSHEQHLILLQNVFGKIRSLSDGSKVDKFATLQTFGNAYGWEVSSGACVLLLSQKMSPKMLGKMLVKWLNAWLNA
jgi:hypothetical protein